MLTFENVGLRYGVGAETLRDVNFQIEPRSFQFLTGPSGAGKTTLMRLIIMALRPTRGLINIFGKDTAALSNEDVAETRRKIGVVFQDFRLLDHLTLYENVALPLRVLGREESTYRAEVLELLRWVGLGERAHAFPTVLSGGFIELHRSGTAVIIATHDLSLMDQYEDARRLVLADGRLHIFE
ncbi:MAG: cell division ATP binding protein FtsE [Methylocystaceae bacterium]|nr:MAG: cell division ATP binding protein FtsE [Methylocystaceae bacterium]